VTPTAGGKSSKIALVRPGWRLLLRLHLLLLHLLMNAAVCHCKGLVGPRKVGD
jgi:hypothetical protein